LNGWAQRGEDPADRLKMRGSARTRVKYDEIFGDRNRIYCHTYPFQGKALVLEFYRDSAYYPRNNSGLMDLLSFGTYKIPCNIH